MKEKFEFRFQKILDYRETIKKQKQEELTGYMKRLEEEKERLNELIVKRQSIFNEMDSKSSSGIPAYHLIQYSKYLQSLKSFIERQKLSTDVMEKKVEYCREELVEASMDQRVMGKLKAREYDKFAYELNREREKEIDDLVNFKLVKA